MTQMFISDLHLDPSLSSLNKGFLHFLQTEAQSAKHLYILGDLFELWLGDDHITKFSKSITDALSALPGRVFLMHGNRDFLIGERFCREANATLLKDPTIIDTPAGAALVLHGDSLCTRDKPYMEARQKLRSRQFQKQFLAKGLEDRAIIAKQIRGESRSLKRETAMDIMDVTPKEVVRVLRDNKVSIMIHGHTHRPAVNSLTVDGKVATRYVLGDWGQTMQYLVIDGKEPRLMSYDVGIPE